MYTETSLSRPPYIPVFAITAQFSRNGFLHMNFPFIYRPSLVILSIPAPVEILLDGISSYYYKTYIIFLFIPVDRNTIRKYTMHHNIKSNCVTTRGNVNWITGISASVTLNNELPLYTLLYHLPFMLLYRSRLIPAKNPWTGLTGIKRFHCI